MTCERVMLDHVNEMSDLVVMDNDDVVNQVVHVSLLVVVAVLSL